MFEPVGLALVDINFKNLERRVRRLPFDRVLHRISSSNETSFCSYEMLHQETKKTAQIKQVITDVRLKTGVTDEELAQKICDLMNGDK